MASLDTQIKVVAESFIKDSRISVCDNTKCTYNGSQYTDFEDCKCKLKIIHLDSNGHCFEQKVD